MSKRTSPPAMVWKIFLFAVLACAFAFALVIAGGVYWAASHRGQQGEAKEEVGWEAPAEAEVTSEITAATNVVTIAEATPNTPKSETPLDTAAAPLAISENSIEEAKPDAPAQQPEVSETMVAITSKARKAIPAEDLFRDSFIPRLKITIPSAGMSALSGNPRKYVRATIQEGDKLYTNVAIRLKGGPGSYRDLRDHPAFTVNFDEFAPGQTFHGLKKIHLNNSVQDGSLLHEKISRELFEAAGVPAPRSGHAAITFNKREMGMYVLVEGINKQFLKRHFKDADGNVYDGKSGTDVSNNLPTNSGENRADKSRLKALAAAVRQTDPALRLEALEKTLDIERFLSFMAMETILGHWDGYTTDRNNYRIFHDRHTDRMVFLPQGMDQILGNTRGSVMPQAGGLVARAILEIPQTRQRYRARIAEISTNLFKPEVINERIDAVSQKVYAALADYDSQAAEAHRSRAAAFRRRVQARSNNLLTQIAPARVVKVGEAPAPLSDWQPRRDLGEATLTKEKDEAGNPLLRISTKDGCTASWRTSALLNPGKYRLEARIKTENVALDPSDPRAGAGLRISRTRTGQKNLGDKDWTPIAFDFEVAEEQSAIELICELRANQGDIWYDVKSLKLSRR